MSRSKGVAAQRSPFLLALILGLFVFVAGYLVEAIAHHVSHSLAVPAPLEALVDAAALVALLSPIVFFVVFRPLTRLVSEHERAEAALQAAHDQLEVRVAQRTAELEERNRKLALLAEMADFLQACATAPEAYGVVAHTAEQLFPQSGGAIFIVSVGGDELQAVASWGDFALSANERVFPTAECWAMRRGCVHKVDALCSAPPCRHSSSSPLPSGSLCAPIIAQGESLGVLHVRGNPSPPESAEDAVALTEWVIAPLVEHIAQVLANLKLREALQNESIRDPLTGLFNRRYLEETLGRELQRARRAQQPLGVVMLDLDHFKLVNDSFGHAAGDALLREVGALLMAQFRSADIACRYGGEEFVLILPEMPLEVVEQRVEALRRGVKRLSLSQQGQQPGALTLSAGIAALPQHGQEAEDLLLAADRALYRAKSEGRDRVVVADTPIADSSHEQLPRDCREVDVCTTVTCAPR